MQARTFALRYLAWHERAALAGARRAVLFSGRQA